MEPTAAQYYTEYPRVFDGWNGDYVVIHRIKGV